MPLKSFREFLELESSSGIILVVAAVLAMVFNNSPLSSLYGLFLDVPLEIRVGALKIAKPLLLWINDGLMAIFFLLIGLEVKREMLEGELSSISQVALPGIAALGGMMVPAGIYVFLNRADPVALNGWAIPAATDIAFALGVLALLGEKVPPGLKLFLLAVAILDDIGAIVIIALFYSGDLSALSIVMAALVLGGLILLNRLRVTKISPYVVLGIALWICVLKSGVHATLAGVALAFCIPLRGKSEGDPSPAHNVEHALHPWVTFGILPLFAFANAGVSLSGISFDTLFARVPLGIATGLFIGKQAGVFGFSWLAVKLRLAKLPEDVTWLEFYGLSVLCGIGFTMSLFIGSLAFERGGPDIETAVRLGVLTGTLLSGLFGYFLLHKAMKARPAVLR
jgi:NhaA family Na+:H+ antiporter